jgi:hypothetical protein
MALRNGTVRAAMKWTGGADSTARPFAESYNSHEIKRTD